MVFRTILNKKEIEPLKNSISYHSIIGLVGSCFVENMGNQLDYYRLNHWVNPYGILFNPMAIERMFLEILQQKQYQETDLIFEKGQWHSLHHHSNFSNFEKQQVLDLINNSIKRAYRQFKNTTHLILTLGSAWVYHHIETDQLVANCHKIPQQNFVKRLLSISEIKKSLQRIIDLARQINPSIQIIFTVSPVRHIKDGMIANSQGKSHLLSAIHSVISPLDEVLYFPSYELMLDDLRDYRFFAKDMLHPNEIAVEYIWNYFKEIWIESDTHAIMDRVDTIQRGLQHRAFSPNSEAHQSFVKKIADQKKYLFEQYGITF